MPLVASGQFGSSSSSSMGDSRQSAPSTGDSSSGQMPAMSMPTSMGTPQMGSRQLGNGPGQTQGLPSASDLFVQQLMQMRNPSQTPLEKSAFQKFVEDAVGHPVLVFGRDLFDRAALTFAPLDNVPVPASYVLGPGDELVVRAWGKINVDTRFLIDRNGQISIPTVGALNVAGLRNDQAEGFLRSAVGKYYKDFDLNVTLGRLRSIQIYLVGAARQPGAYTVGSLSTLVNAVFSTGGPTQAGSIRRIELRRGATTVAVFDLYDLLLRGDQSKDVKLQQGDVLFYPPVGPQVALDGHVNTPAIYELKPDETLGVAITLAGGLDSLAATDRVFLERIEDHKARQVQEFALNQEQMKEALRDGDILRINPISPRFNQSVTLRGSVLDPGRFGWHEGMRVSDLIPNREFLVTRSHWNLQNHLADIPADPALQSSVLGGNTLVTYNDLLNANSLSITGTNGVNGQPQTVSPLLASQQQLNQNQAQGAQGGPQNGPSPLNVPVAALAQPQQQQQQQMPMQMPMSTQMPGAVVDPSRLQSNPLSGNQTARGFRQTVDLQSDLDRTNAEINWEYAVIQRLDDHDLSTRLIPFNLAAAIDHPDSVENQMLKPGDVVTIFSRYDIDLPASKHAVFVQIGGEVNVPGVYRMNPGETLQDLVRRAGGLTSRSYLFSSKLTRQATLRAQLEEQEKYLNQMQQQILAQNERATTDSAAVSSATDQQALMAAQQAAMSKLQQIKPDGRVVLKISPEAQDVTDLPAIELEDGDVFTVPQRLNTVQVLGSVYNEAAFRFAPGKRMRSYLADAGGPTREADWRRAFIIRADGSVIGHQAWHAAGAHVDIEKVVMYPGDAIVVPLKVHEAFTLKDLANVSQVFGTLALTSAAVAAIK